MASTLQNSEDATTAIFNNNNNNNNNNNGLLNGGGGVVGSTPTPYSQITVGVLKETYPGENRVCLAPESVQLLIEAGMNVVVESGGEFCIHVYVCVCLRVCATAADTHG